MILLGMLVDDNIEERKKALLLLEGAKVGQRHYKIPKLNEQATSHSTLVDFRQLEYVKPPLIDDQDFSDFHQAKDIGDIPSNTQGIERLVQRCKNSCLHRCSVEKVELSVQGGLRRIENFPLRSMNSSLIIDQ